MPMARSGSRSRPSGARRSRALSRPGSPWSPRARRQEARVGSRTVLDVLTEQQNLLNAQLNLVEARRNEVVAGYRLRAAIGTLTARDLALPVEVYDPEPDYRKTRSRWWGTSVDGWPPPSPGSPHDVVRSK